MSINSSHPGLQLRNRRILLVADDRAKVQRLTDILVPEGYHVARVGTDAEALEYCALVQPDLILLDAELTGANVFEVCRGLKVRYGENRPTVIFISSISDPAAVVDGLAAGGVDYLSQPFREAEVVARIRVHLLNRLRLAQLSKEDQAKNRLLGMAAHDLRNPLVSIRALTSLLRAGKLGEVSPAQHELLDTIYDASESMLELVNGLLDVSALAAGQLKLNLAPAVLSELIEAAIKMNNATAAEKATHIVMEAGPVLPVLPVDAPKISQVMNNLLDNAIKFSPPGSTITVKGSVVGGSCTISVHDQGPGIRAAERGNLFKDFSRTSVQPTAGEPSTGLGLAICHKIMQAHGGSIQTRNIPGGGAEFRITFAPTP